LEFLSEYGMFLAKAITIVIAILVVVGSIASAGQKGKKPPGGHIEVTNLSEEISELKDEMHKEVLSEEEYKLLAKERKKQAKEEEKQKKKLQKSAKQHDDSGNKEIEGKKNSQTETEASSKEEDESDNKKRLYVLDFDGDVEASDVANLREEITAILGVAEEGDEVLLRLESPGGMVHAYGLASSQLARIKTAKLKLTIAVDQVAASGGYMMACVADQIICAPFAVVGSIGVIAEIPNFNRLLKHNLVDYEQHTAGEYKRTLTMFAENTDAAREKFKQELEETHQLFKQFINQNRPKVDIEKVSTGEHWYGLQAKDLNLIDEIMVSDDYILDSQEKFEIYSVSYVVKKSLSERLSFSIRTAIEKGFLAIWQKSNESKLFRG